MFLNLSAAARVEEIRRELVAVWHSFHILFKIDHFYLPREVFFKLASSETEVFREGKPGVLQIAE